MKTLVLIRHAKSSWSDPELQDIDRPLNKRGQRDAPFMGNKLKQAGIKPDLILSSPANRAFSTAKIIAEATNYPVSKIKLEKTIYGAYESELINLLRTVGDKHELLFMFGHNPEFTSFANRFIKGDYIDNVPTCGMVFIEFKIDSWSELDLDNGKVKSFIYPKLY